MNAPTIKRLVVPTDLEPAFAIRREVFIDEQGIDREVEFDGLDDGCDHLLAVLDDRPVGTLRLRMVDRGRIAKIERVAVIEAARGRHVGVRLIGDALERARQLGATAALLHAQTRVEGFYARLGFVAFGDVFEEDGIPHIAMRKPLTGDQTTRTR